MVLFPLFARAQAENPALARLLGEDSVVLGPAGETFVGPGNARMLSSGSEVRVRSGDARLELVKGGIVQICGPAHFTLLGSGDQLTLALESGRLELQGSAAAIVAIYTAVIVARPVEISGEPVDFLLGLEPSGDICIRAGAGAVELEEQLSGKKLIVPQGGEILLPGGRLAGMREAPGACRCRVERAERATPPAIPAPPETEASEDAGRVFRAAGSGGRAAAPAERARLSPPTPPPERAAPPAPPQPVAGPPEGTAPPPVASGLSSADVSLPTAPLEHPVAPAPAQAVAPPETSPPVWKVIMPPLVFNAREPAPPPEPSPEIVQLIREARVAPALVIRGEVVPQPARKKGGSGFWSKLGGFFGHLFGRHAEPRA